MAMLYKIRDPLNGLYSDGGFDPVSYSKKGKTWTSLAALNSHLASSRNCYREGCVLEIYEIPEPVLIEKKPLTAHIEERKAHNAEQLRIKKEREALRELEAKRAQYEELKSFFEGKQ